MQDIYEKLIKGYTEKQWGRPCDQLPAFIIKRLPCALHLIIIILMHYIRGFRLADIRKMVANMLEGIEIQLGIDYLENKQEYDKIAERVIYTGAIDAYFGFKSRNIGISFGSF